MALVFIDPKWRETTARKCERQLISLADQRMRMLLQLLRLEKARHMLSRHPPHISARYCHTDVSVRFDSAALSESRIELTTRIVSYRNCRGGGGD